MLTTFNPVEFSDQENRWFLKHLGEPYVVASRDIHPKRLENPNIRDVNPIHYPDGVAPSSVRPVIDGVYELLQLEKIDGLKWVGTDAVKSAINVWLTQNAKWASDHKRSSRAPRWPSHYSFDARGGAHLGAPGSDNGSIKTYYGPAGERIPFAIELLPSTDMPWAPPGHGMATDRPLDPALNIDSTAHRIECKVPMPDGTFCGHTETYKVDSRKSYNAAKARMSKHMRRATEEVEAHRLLHANEFSS